MRVSLEPLRQLPTHRSGQTAQWAALALVVAAALVLPLSLRVINGLIPGAHGASSYVPALSPARDRAPFDAEVVATLREAEPDYIVIGDSMAGTRLDDRYLSRLVGGHGVAPILHPGSGSAYWYLVFKNWVIGSHIRPKAVIFFFRDENLTDLLFRLYPDSLDRVARDREPVLNDLIGARSNGTFYRVHNLLESVYQFHRTRDWLEPAIAQAPLALAAGRRYRKKLVERMNAELFTLDAIRPMTAADMQATGDAPLDFQKDLPTSVLPEILRLAQASHLKVAFVRVQRRPTTQGPPIQSLALRRYVQELRSYLLANGAIFRDDWGDPDQPLSIYEDGDHIERGHLRHYTELLFRKNPDIFR